jgi:hypothetical protein
MKRRFLQEPHGETSGILDIAAVFLLGSLVDPPDKGDVFGRAFLVFLVFFVSRFMAISFHHPGAARQSACGTTPLSISRVRHQVPTEQLAHQLMELREIRKSGKTLKRCQAMRRLCLTEIQHFACDFSMKKGRRELHSERVQTAQYSRQQH